VAVRNVVIGQKIDAIKIESAKNLRRIMTPAERLLWHALRNNRLHGLHFRRQQVIAGFVADFYCHAASLVVEVDGPVHERRAQGDVERDAVLSGMGLRVLRVRNEEVFSDLTGVMRRIIALART